VDPKTWVINRETALFNIPGELGIAVTIPVAFVSSSLFIARLNASHKEKTTHGMGIKQEGAKGYVWTNEEGSNRRCKMKCLISDTHHQVLLTKPM
jgi:hypothetical protein